MYNPQSLIASKKKWDVLSKEEQDILASTALEARDWQRKNARALADKSLASLKKSMEVTELPPAEVAKIREKLKPVIEKYSANVGADLVKELQAELEKVRK